VEDGKLGKTYSNGKVIVRQGEMGDRMFVIQSGRVRVTRTVDGREIELAELKEGDFFGEMAIIDRETRSATVSAVGDVRLLSIDKKNFLRRIHEDPSLAYRVLQRMSLKIRELDAKLTQLKSRDLGNP
jgi:CRP-like cAMP-binding protein